ncbi:MAG: transglutaminase family protein [Pseudomonadota bacterium]
MRLAIRHVTTYTYAPAADGLALRLRLFPIQTVQQRPVSWQVSVNEEVVRPLVVSGFGEGEALWFSRRKDDRVEIVVEGVIETEDKAGVLGQMGRARPGIFLRETALTAPGEAVVGLAEKVEGAGVLDRLHALNAVLHEALEYRKGVTEHRTTADQAAALGAGVCQDFAHVFIAAARHLGVPARYVVGYLQDDDARETASHAWAEAHVDGLGWVGFDPVRDVCPADHHVRLCTGFDADDASPIRGTMRPGSEEEMAVEVTISPSQTQSQIQSQSQSQS